ncbi:MAG: metallophosphoesterase [Armatimonadota bacterium]
MRTFGLIIVITLLTVSMLGWIVGDWIAVYTFTVPIGLKEPLKFAVISDIHVGVGGRGVEKARKALQKVMRQQPDAIFLLGDFVNGRGAIPHIEPALKGINAPLGVYAVLGNHDHWADAHRVTSSLRRVGIRVLINESAILRKGDSTVALVGIDDLWSGKPNWWKAFSNVPKGAPIILLSHNPDAAIFWLPISEQRKFLTKHAAITLDDMKRHGSFLRRQPVKLILSGHTHGGHVWLPVNRLFARLTRRRGIPVTEYGWRYPYGLRDIGTTWVYITKGVTVGNLTPRWFNAREIAIVKVR